LKIHIIIPSSTGHHELSKLGRLAEEYGLDCLWLENSIRSRDQFVNLSYLARDTEKIRIGPIAISPFEHHPVRLGMLLLTMNDISKGRATIALGAGGGGTTQYFGIATPRPVAAVRECLEIIKGMNKNREFSYEGTVYKVKKVVGKWDYSLGMLYIAANRPKMLSVACRIADGIMVTDMPIKQIEAVSKFVKKELEKAGKDAVAFRLNNFFAWHVKESYEEAVAEARRNLIVRALPIDLGYPAEYIGLTDEDLKIIKDKRMKLVKLFLEGRQPEGLPEHIMDAITEELTITASIKDADRCVERLRAFEKAGLNEIALKLHENAKQDIKFLGEKVQPHLIKD
jgi:5,10-methylenetetrahydromethanopterin reductase